MTLLSIDPSLADGCYYRDGVAMPPAQPPLLGAQRCDVAVIGGGLAGLSAALELAGRGFQVRLLEARRVGWGASGRNGGQVIAGLACDPQVIEQQLGLAEARRVWQMTVDAIARLRARCAEAGIDCDWRDGYLAVADHARKTAALRRWADDLMQRYQHALRWIAPAELPGWLASPRYHSGAHDPLGGHIHPLKYCLGVARAAAARGVLIHEHSEVLKWQAGPPVRLWTEHGVLSADRLLLAGNVYQQGLAPALDARIMPVGTYIVGTERLDEARAQALIPCGAAVCDSNFVLDYFRTTADHRLLFGGRVSYSTRTPGNLVSGLGARLLRTFPQLHGVRIEHAWGGFVDITRNRAPDFGRLHPHVYYLQGFSGHGLALTGLAGQLVAEAMAADASRFDVFARLRHRRFPGGPLLRMPALVLAMAYYRLRDLV